MTTVLTLTTAGTNSGPFDLYSDLDGYTVPFETGVSRAALQAGHSTTLVPDYSNVVRIKSTGTCINSVDITLTTPTTSTTSTTLTPLSYCVTWVANNEGNIRMSTQGTIDFTAILAGRTINIGASAGTLTEYVIAGVGTFPCSIPMTFTTSTANWNNNTLPVVTDTVLTTLRYFVEIIFNDVSEFSIENGETNAIVTAPPQLSSSFDNCP